MTQNIQATLPAGTYYIGDPCYVFSEHWDLILETTNYLGNDKRGGVFKINDSPIVCGNTAYGDGEYRDNLKFKYSVDSGCLAILPIELLKLDNKSTLGQAQQDDHLQIVSFASSFNCSIVNGVFCFGHVTINTN